MKIYSIILLTLSLIVVTIKLCAQITDDSTFVFPDQWNEEQKNIITNNIKTFPKGTQISMAIMDGDQTEYLGIINEEGQLKNINNSSSQFEIGSISKVFTSALFADAVTKGDVSFETEITDLLGYKLLNNNKITLVQLSNHTSGMQRMPANFMFAHMKDPNNPYLHYTEENLKSWLTEYMTAELKQDKSEYSNLGMGVLAHGLTKKYNKSYDQLLKEIIFQPLGMEHSTSNQKNKESNMVKGLDPNGNIATNWEFDVLEGAGAIISTIEDLELFVKAVLEKKIPFLDLQTQPTFKVHENMSMGLGWHIIHGKNGNDYLFHNGATNGYSSSLLIDTDSGKAIMLLSNISYQHPNFTNIDTLVFALMKTL